MNVAKQHAALYWKAYAEIDWQEGIRTNPIADLSGDSRQAG